jgi:carotenoid 1,2-hydratase
VFSPYYAWARRRGPGDPFRHVGLNVALYGERKGWALTERGRGALQRGTDFLSIGPSALSWEGGVLTVRIDEVTAPIPSRIRGTVRLFPDAVERRVRTLDAAGRHRWRPIAPCARAEIVLESPSLCWSGAAYFDTNAGDAPLEADFSSWTWSRSPGLEGTEVLYDVQRRDGSRLSLAMQYARTGGVADIRPPETVLLPRTKWGVARSTRAAAGQVRVKQTLEDTPFYARSLLVNGAAETMHESLSLDRFRTPWVQAMLPFRIPRAIR